MTTPDRVEVLVVGDYYVDLVFAGTPTWPQPGTETFAESFATVPGGAYTHALALHRLGAQTQWATEFGTDPYSRWVIATAEEAGLDLTHAIRCDGPMRNVSVSISQSADRGFLSYRESKHPLDLAPLIRAVSPRVLLLPALIHDDQADTMLTAAATAGTNVFMDCQHTDATLTSPEVREVLARITVFAPNAAEARALTGFDDLNAAAVRLGEIVPVVLVKDGARGALAVSGGAMVREPALPVVAVDTTGAGDCFDAGFLYAWLRGHALSTCLRAAVACGSLATTGYGSEAAPNLEDLVTAVPGLRPTTTERA